tara:strand:+ start:320 stop:721 length:402 start_codon:yes stop_codon:yes gene_type:complete
VKPINASKNNMIDKTKTLKKLELLRAIAAIAGPIAAPRVAKDVPAATMLPFLSKFANNVVMKVRQYDQEAPMKHSSIKNQKKVFVDKSKAKLRIEIKIPISNGGTVPNLCPIKIIIKAAGIPIIVDQNKAIPI